MKPTIAETIGKQLANRILTGEYAPGQRIEEQELALQFGVSRTPVREALRQLAAAGLVSMRPHCGVTVMNPELSEVAEMFEALGEIEALCARFSAQRMTPIERHKLQRQVEDTESRVAAQDFENYSDANEALHKMIYAGARNASLEALALQLWNRLAPFRRSVFFRQRGRLERSLEEHRRVVGAIARGDAEQAAVAMREHVVNSGANAIDFLAAPRAS
jgi:DNA-binding GntR family transcriptional regulator